MPGRKYPLIAVCDREPDILESVDLLLKTSGFSTATFKIEHSSENEAALAGWLSKSEPKIVLFDQEPTFYEPTEHFPIVQKWVSERSSCLILMSSFPKDAQSCQEHVSGVIVKPFDVKTLLGVIEKGCRL